MVSLVYPGHDGKIFVTALTPLMFGAAESSLVRRGLSGFVAVSLVVGLVILTTHFQMAYFLFGGVGIYYALRCVSDLEVGREHRRGDGGAGGGRRSARNGPLATPKITLGRGPPGPPEALCVPGGFSPGSGDRRDAASACGRLRDRVLAPDGHDHCSLFRGRRRIFELLVTASGGDRVAGGTGIRRQLELGCALGTRYVLGPESVQEQSRIRRVDGFSPGDPVVLRWPPSVGALEPCRDRSGRGAVHLGLHTPVWRIFYTLVPGVSWFRAPSMAVFLFGFAATTLAALGVDRGLEMWGTGENGSASRYARRAAWALVGWVGALIAATALSAAGGLGWLWTTLVYRDIDVSRLQTFESLAPFLTRGLSVAVLLAGGTAASWWALRRGWLKPSGVVSILGLLIVMDFFRIGDPFIRTQDFDALVAPDPNVQFLVQRANEEPPFRVLSFMDWGNVGQDVAPAIHGLELAAGHHPNDLARYRDLVGIIGSGVPANFFDPATGEINSNLTGVLNVRYLLWPQYRYTPPVSDIEPVSSTTLADGRPYSAVYPLDDLPRARLVGTVRVVPDERAVSVILSDAFDPATEVLLAEPPPEPLAPGPVRGTVEWVERGVNEQFLRVDSDRAALLVISDNWFPAWHARVDGVEAPVLRANYTLRAVPVPAGQSEVHLYYRSNALRGGLFLSLASLLVVGVVAAVPVIAGARRGRNGA